MTMRCRSDEHLALLWVYHHSGYKLPYLCQKKIRADMETIVAV